MCVRALAASLGLQLGGLAPRAWVRRASPALSPAPPPAHACHHDLTPANFGRGTLLLPLLMPGGAEPGDNTQHASGSADDASLGRTCRHRRPSGSQCAHSGPQGKGKDRWAQRVCGALAIRREASSGIVPAIGCRQPKRSSGTRAHRVIRRNGWLAFKCSRGRIDNVALWLLDATRFSIP